MEFTSLLAFVSAILCGALAMVVLFEKQRSLVQWTFAAGMSGFGLEAALKAFCR